MNEKLFSEIDYLSSLEEYLEFISEHFDIDSEEVLMEIQTQKLEKTEPITWEEVLVADGMDGIWEEDSAKKKNPQDYPKGTFHLDTHFRGASAHRDLRIKMNDHLQGFTITDQVEGAIKERVDTLAKARQYRWNDSKIFKFQPDMGDKNVKVVAIPKADQPCISADSFIIKNQTLEKAGNLRVDDKVLTGDGTFQPILKIERVKKLEQFQIKPMFGLPIQTDGDHPFLINDVNWKSQADLSHMRRAKLHEFKPIWKKCRDLKINDVLLFPKLKISKRKKIGNKDLGRLIGYYLGDGNLFKAGYKDKFNQYRSKYCRLYFNSRDEDLMQKYQKILSNLNIHFWWKKPDKNAKSLVFSLNSNEIDFPKPKNIPQEFLFANRHFQKGLVEGLVDSDGYISKDGRKHFINLNLSLLNGLVLILHQLEIIPFFRWRKNWNFEHTQKINMIGELNWGSKHKYYFNYKNYFGFRITKIKSVSPKPLINIITSNHTFCSPYFTTHNTAWMNVRNVVFPAGSVGSTRFEKGVFLSVDEGLAFMGVQKPYFKEWWLKGKHFNGRFVIRLIPVRPEWKKKPKAKLQFQAWMTESTPKGQLPYLLSPRGRSRKDVAPPEGESWLPPEWEKKIKDEYRWWPNSKSKAEKIKLIDQAFNDLIERDEIKARKLKLSKAKYFPITKSKEDMTLEDFEYLLHHIEVDEKGKEEIHHCYLYDHIANMFEQAHLWIKDGKVYLDGKQVKEGIFHVIKGLEPTQEVNWSDKEAMENGIKPKKMKAGMTLKEKAREW